MIDSPSRIQTNPTQPHRNVDEPLVLVLAADDRFAMPMAVALCSVLAHVPVGQRIDVYILDAGLLEGAKERVHRILTRAGNDARIHWIDPDLSLLAGVDIHMMSRFSAANLYRLVIPEVLPQTVTRALYLDSDVIVEDDVTALWQTDLGPYPLAAVQERTIGCSKYGVGGWERLQIDPTAPYFNSGVLLMDLDVWRTEGIHESVVDYFRNCENDLLFPSDQEGLNAVLVGRWLPLDPRWNVVHNYYLPDSWSEISHQVNVADPSSVAEDAHIIHYSSEHKPWLPGCPHPRRDRFRHYLRESGWFTPYEYAAWAAAFHCRDWYGSVRRALRPFKVRWKQHFL